MKLFKLKVNGILSVALLLFIVLIICIGCDSSSQHGSNNSIQDNNGLGVAGENAAEEIAAKAFVAAATQALEADCKKGQSSSCKIAFAVDPNFKTEMTLDEINQKLDAMKKQLDKMVDMLSTIEGLLTDLSAQLTISVADLKFDNAQVVASGYMRNIASAYDSLESTDFSKSTVDPAHYVSSAMTNLPSDTPWIVPYNMNMLHQQIIDTSSQGLFVKLGDLVTTRWDAKLPSDGEAIATYEFIEQYFGYLLAEQAKGLIVISACYNYLSSYPNQEILGALSYQTFDAYKENVYIPNIEKQTKVFLQIVDRYVAKVTDGDKSGDDIKPWVSEVYRRADMMAEWARISLIKNDSSSSVIPVRLIVRVIGEPDRVNLLLSQNITDNSAKVSYIIDEKCLGPDNKLSKLRKWTARSPYIEFPLHLNLPEGDVKREGAMKGTNSISMIKYMLTENDFKDSIQAGTRTVVLPDWIGNLNMLINLVGPTGNPPSEEDDPEMLFGHITIVLKEKAAKRGIWIGDGPSGVVAPSDLKAYFAMGEKQTTFPQMVQIHLFAEPKRWTQSFGEYDQSYIRGNAYYYMKLEGAYYFEGWDDDLEPKKPQPTIYGSASRVIKETAPNGSYQTEVYFYQEDPENIQSNITMTTDKQDIILKVDPTNAWEAGKTIKFAIQSREHATWNALSASAFDVEYFDGTTTFDLDRLVLHLK